MELTIALKERGKIPWYSQLYSQIRDAILSGRLRPGEKLPSTRELATRLQLSRNTVNLAYERLLGEGYLESRRGSGTYVGSNIFPQSGRKAEAMPAAPEQISLGRWARNLHRWVYTPPMRSLPYDFRPGMPALDHFPTAVWLRIVRHHLNRPLRELSRYDEPGGHRPLREAIATYLRRSRAVVCDANQVFVTTGSQQAFDILARLLIRTRDRVIIENPTYPAAVAAFRAAGAKLSPISVDNEGIQTNFLSQGARALYVTPSHQFPTGALLPLSRRLSLLSWARKNRTVIIEDDYDSEFRYSGRPVESLQGLDSSGLVIYLGTFSKVLFPTLRLGYVVLPLSLIKPFLALKWISDRHTSGLEQRFLAEFMVEGCFERYLHKMRKIYQDQREALIESLAQHARNYIEVVPSVAGLHLTGWLKGRFELTRLISLSEEMGVGIYPLTPYFLEKARPGLLFGYSAISKDEICMGIRHLGQVLTSLAS